MAKKVLDIVIEPIEDRPSTVMLTSTAMQCEFPIKEEDIGAQVASLHAEWAGLVEAEVI